MENMGNLIKEANMTAICNPAVGDVWESNLHPDEPFCIVYADIDHVAMCAGRESSKPNNFSIECETIVMVRKHEFIEYLIQLCRNEKYCLMYTLELTTAQQRMLRTLAYSSMGEDSSVEEEPMKCDEEDDKSNDDKKQTKMNEKCHFCKAESEVLFAKTNLCVSCAEKLFSLRREED